MWVLIVSVPDHCLSFYFTVKVFNISARTVTVKPKTPLCELHEVKVPRNVNPLLSEEESTRVEVNQQTVMEISEEEIKLPDGIDLSYSSITPKQKRKKKWRCRWTFQETGRRIFNNDHYLSRRA